MMKGKDIFLLLKLTSLCYLIWHFQEQMLAIIQRDGARVYSARLGWPSFLTPPSLGSNSFLEYKGLISYFSCCCNKIPSKGSLRECASAYSLRVQSITMGKAWQQE